MQEAETELPPPYDPAWAPDAGAEGGAVGGGGDGGGAAEKGHANGDYGAVDVAKGGRNASGQPVCPSAPLLPDESGATQESVVAIQPQSVSPECSVCQRLAAGESIPWDDDDPFGDKQIPLLDAARVHRVFSPDGETMSASEFLSQESRPPDPPFRGCPAKRCRILSIVVHVGIWIDVVMVARIIMAHEKRLQSDPDYEVMSEYVLPVVFGIMIGIIAYFIIPIEGFKATVTDFFINTRQMDETKHYIHTLRHAAPRLVLKVVAYKWHTVLGVTRKIVVHTEKRQLVLTKCVDISHELDQTQWGKAKFIKLTMKTQVCFSDEETMNSYKMLQRDADSACRSYVGGLDDSSDIWIEFKPVVKIANFKKCTLVNRYTNVLPKYVFPVCHVFTVLLALSWPFRLWFKCSSEKQTHVIMKMVGR